MQGLVLQLTRSGFLLLWLFIWSVLRILRTDIYAPTGRSWSAAAALRAPLLPSQHRHGARHLVVTEGAAGTRITLGSPAGADRPGRRLDAGAHRRLRLHRHARLSQRGSDWYVEIQDRPTVPTSTGRR